MKQLKNFYLFIFGQSISQLGSKMTGYGLVLWAYAQTESALTAAILSVCSLLPSILLSFISGSLSDGWEKKKIMLAADTVAALCSACVFVLLVAGRLRVEYLYVINLVLGIADSFQNPASEVTISLLVNPKDYVKTSAIRTFSNSVITVFAPMIAASVYAFLGLQWIVVLDLAAYAFAFTTLLFGVKIKELKHAAEHSGESIWYTCRIGLRYIFAEKGIFALILFMACVNFFYGIYSNNMTPMILSRNGGNQFQVGIVNGAIGAAGIVGSLLVPLVSKTKRRMAVNINILAISYLFCDPLLGIGRNFYFWSFAVFAGNMLVPILNANNEYIMRTRVPISMQGRVFAARNTLQYALLPVGNLAGGFLADKVFEPFMMGRGAGIKLLTILVGSGKGSGLALLYIVIAVGSLLMCTIFRFHKDLRALDNKK